MRGQRQVFARGLALALIKKLMLAGRRGLAALLRFAAARDHEDRARSGQVPVPYVLSFRSERGRNYGKVFRQLAVEVTKLRHDQKRRTILYIITHGQCHIDPEIIADLGAHAFLYGIIISPSTDELPDFVASLDRVQVVSPAIFTSRQGRQRRALDIVSDAARRPGARP
jgi:hypothetical protein